MTGRVLVCIGLSVVAACAEEDDPILLNVQDITVTTAEDTPLSLQYTARSNRSVTAMVETPPTNGTVRQVDSLITYTPNANFNGTDTVKVKFDNGQKEVIGTATITVTPVNDAPAAAADSFATGFDRALTVPNTTLLMNDSDIDSGTVLAVSSVGAFSHGTAVISGNNVVFTPESGFTGAATFSYSASDGAAEAVATVTVNIGTNGPPVAANDTATVGEDDALIIPTSTLIGNDTDPDQNTLFVSGVSSPTNGTVTLEGTDVRFVPAANFSGMATFQYTTTDGDGTDNGTVTVTVTPTNDPPMGGADVATTAEDAPYVVQASALIANDSDIDGGDTLSITAVGNAQQGSVARDGDTVTFTPSLNYNGTAGFDYTLSDGTVTTSVHVTVTVSPTNDAPIAVDDTTSIVEDQVTLVGTAVMLANDSDPEGPSLSVTAVSNPTNGTATIAAGGVNFVPAANFVGTAGFDYTVSDGTLTDVGHVTINVTPVNDAPVAIDDNINTPEDVVANLTPTSNDLEPDGDALTITGITQPAHGTATRIGNIVQYTPTLNYHGPDALTYTVSDGTSTVTAAINLTVTPVNDAPTIAMDSAATLEDNSISIDVLANDSDVDNNPLTVSAAGTPANGTTTIVNNRVVYEPAINFFGTDVFTYEASDGLLTTTGMVTVTVTPVNDAPIANDDTYEATGDIATTAINGILVNDVDDGPGVTTLVIDSYPFNGDLTLNQDGSFTYEPYNDCVTEDSFHYYLDDGTFQSNIAVVHLVVNHPVEANDDWYYPTMNQPFAIGPSGVLGNDYDFDDDQLTATLVTGPTTTSDLTFNADGSFTWIPPMGFTGDVTFTYTASDGLTTSTATVHLWVSGQSYYAPDALAETTFKIGETAAKLKELDQTIHGGKSCCYYDFAAPAQPGEREEPDLVIYGGYGCCGKYGCDKITDVTDDVDVLMDMNVSRNVE